MNRRTKAGIWGRVVPTAIALIVVVAFALNCQPPSGEAAQADDTYPPSTGLSKEDLLNLILKTYSVDLVYTHGPVQLFYEHMVPKEGFGRALVSYDLTSGKEVVCSVGADPATGLVRTVSVYSNKRDCVEVNLDPGTGQVRMLSLTIWRGKGWEAPSVILQDLDLDGRWDCKFVMAKSAGGFNVWYDGKWVLARRKKGKVDAMLNGSWEHMSFENGKWKQGEPASSSQ